MFPVSPHTSSCTEASDSTRSVHGKSPCCAVRLSSLCPLFCLDGVKQRSQDQERQGLEERVRGDQEDLPNGGAAAARERDHEERSGQEIPLLW